MYIHAGNGKMIRTREIVGIFDMDSSTMGAGTRELLKRAEREGRMVSIGDDIPKSVIVMRDGSVYVSVISASALSGRQGIIAALGQ